MLLGSSHSYSWLIVEENGRQGDDEIDDDNCCEVINRNNNFCIYNWMMFQKIYLQNIKNSL